MKLLSQRTSLDKVLKDPKLSKKAKKKLLLALEAKEFAESNLGLKPSKNYTSYVDIQRPYVTYIVRVAYRDKLESKNWWYPIVGSLPYKGFFSKKEAEEEAQTFDKEKFDTYVRGASAYSTLGWFNDPILSSMLTYNDAQLVNLIIHESVHASLFIKGQASFNERLATFLGNIGTTLFYKAKEGETSSTVDRIKMGNRDKKRFSAFISPEIKSLRKWYKEQKNLSNESKLQRLNEIQTRFKKDVLPNLELYSYKGFLESKLNNAQLLSLSTYVSDLSDFEELFKLKDSDFNSFLTYCKTLENEKQPIEKMKSDLALLSKKQIKNPPLPQNE